MDWHDRRVIKNSPSGRRQRNRIEDCTRIVQRRLVDGVLSDREDVLIDADRANAAVLGKQAGFGNAAGRIDFQEVVAGRGAALNRNRQNLFVGKP